MTKWILVTCSVFLAVGMLGTLALADDGINIWIEPYVINLNSNSGGNADNEVCNADHDVIVTLGSTNLNGMYITEQTITFMVDGNSVDSAVARSARVTRYGLVQVYFDKSDIQGLAEGPTGDSGVGVTVSGTYTCAPIGGDPFDPIEFTGAGVVVFK